MITLWILSLLKSSEGGNPLVPHVGMADPHVHTWNHRVYMYSTHDQNISVSNASACTGPWWIWSSEDLVNWRYESLFSGFSWAPADYLHTKHLYWATDAAERDGKYYWYVSIGGRSIAVIISSSPTGPWEDPLSGLLFNSTYGDSLKPPSCIRDPGTLADNDGRYYIVFGACSGKVQPNDSCYYAAELNEDMTSFKTPRHLSIQGAMGPYGPGKADDKPFLHRRGNLYYLSWGCFYGISESVYGPYVYHGSFMDPLLIAPSFRMNSTSEPWYTREDYADRHGSFLQLHGQWYFFCNDRSHSDALRYNVSGGSFRDTVAAYVHYYNNGSIAPIIIDEKGVANHAFDEEPILPAENYFTMQGAEKLEGPEGGFVVSGLKASSSLSFINVRGLHSEGVLQLHASNGGTCAGGVNVYVGSSLFASCILPPTGDWQSYIDVSCLSEGSALSSSTSNKLVLQFRGCGDAEFARLDHIAFIADKKALVSA